MIEIDNKQVDTTLDILDDDEMKRNIIFKAMKSGANVLRESTKEYFKSKLGDVANHYSKYIKAPFYEGVIMKGDKAYLEVKVSIMKDFRMKFFEKGTNDRYTKDNHYRGKMIGKYFFKDARTASTEKVESAIAQTMDNEIKKMLK